MASKARIITQWLETDAAFGAAQVPIPRGAGKRAGAAGAAGAAGKSSAPVRVAAARLVEAAPGRVAAPMAAPAAARPVIRPVQNPMEDSTLARPRSVVKSVSVSIPGPPAGDLTALPALSRAEKTVALAALVEETNKGLAKYLDEVATKVVFGEGDLDSPVMFIGEGPGTDEDATGRPFVGRAGQYLDKWITAMKFSREQVYIANVVKLRAASPSEEWGGRLKDRPPTPEEVARNIIYLHKQIEIVRPKVIVTLGAPALRHITGSMEGITKIRGTWLSYRGVPVMPTLHPSYVLRNLGETEASRAIRKNVWDDLKVVMERIGKK